MALEHDMENQAAEAAQMEDVINHVPGGVAVYRLENGKCRTLLFTDGLAALSGRTREEYTQALGEDALQAVYPKDLPKIDRALRTALTSDEPVNESCRVFHKNGSLVWINFSAQKMREENGCPVYHVMMTPVSREAQMYREILEGATIGVCVCEMEGGRVLYANQQFRKLTNDQKEPTAGEKICCYQALAGRSTPCPDCPRHQMTGNAFLRHSLQSVNGRCYQSDSRRIDWNGTPAYISYISDITKQVEEERRIHNRYTEEENKRHLLEKDVMTLCVFNVTQGTLTSCDFHTVRPDDLKLSPGMPMAKALEYLLREVPGEEDRAKLRQQYGRDRLLNRMHQGLVNGALEYRRDNRRGELVWVSDEYNLVEEPSTKDVICYTYVRSIHEKKQYEQMLGTIVDLNYDFALLIDRRTGRAKPMRQNGIMPEASLAYARDPEQARVEMMRRYCGDDDVEDLIQRTGMEAVTTALETQPVYSVAFTFWERGELRNKEMTFAYLDDSHQKLCCVRHDITDLSIAEQKKNRALSEALRRAKEASLAKDDFLSRMSHDIRTPLNGIIGLTDLALSEAKEPTLRTYLTQIDVSSQYLLSLVNDILDMTKISSHKMELHPEPYGYQEWAQMLRAVIGEQSRQKGVRFVTERLDCVAQAILVDKLRFNQIFFNLLSNAVKFTPRGGQVSIACSAVPLEKDRCRMRITVTDTGCGMSPEFLERAFDVFAQEHTASTDDTPGTGLGLSIVKSLVELMGGTISLESAPGKGTQATVELSVTTAALPELPTAQPQIPDLNGCRVLLAEDHPINAMIACKMLEKSGVIVDRVENGQQAVDLFAASAQDGYDAILMDIRMPLLDGLDAARAIRALPRPDAATVPILAMTANAFDDDVQKSLAAGMDDHLAKPVVPERLCQALGSHIARARQAKKKTP